MQYLISFSTSTIAGISCIRSCQSIAEETKTSDFTLQFFTKDSLLANKVDSRNERQQKVDGQLSGSCENITVNFSAENQCEIYDNKKQGVLISATETVERRNIILY